MSPEVALSGSAAKADLSPECAPKRTSVDHFEFMGSRPNLSVLPVHGIEWSDLGEPLRITDALRSNYQRQQQKNRMDHALARAAPLRQIHQSPSHQCEARPS